MSHFVQKCEEFDSIFIQTRHEGSSGVLVPLDMFQFNLRRHSSHPNIGMRNLNVTPGDTDWSRSLSMSIPTPLLRQDWSLINIWSGWFRHTVWYSIPFKLNSHLSDSFRCLFISRTVIFRRSSHKILLRKCTICAISRSINPWGQSTGIELAHKRT